MSLALDFLSEHLAATGTTQADLAKAAGIDPSLFSQIKAGDVSINGKNFPKLMRGLRDDQARLEFLNAYLCDQIPQDYSDRISVRITPATPNGGVTEEETEEPLESQLVTVFAKLPSDNHRRRLIRFVKHLNKDDSLRRFFVKTVDYLEEADLK